MRSKKYPSKKEDRSQHPPSSDCFMVKEKNVVASDSKEYGDVYSLTAIKPDTRLF